MKTQQPTSSMATPLRTVFVEQLGILYSAKISLADHLPLLVDQATFKNLKAALEEDLDDTKRQMISLKLIFRMMQESWLTPDCLGMNIVIKEAQKQLHHKQGNHFESDMSILFYMSVIENLQVGASKMLNLIALKLAYQPYAQLVAECLDTVQDNATLFNDVTEEYLEDNRLNEYPATIK